MPPMETVLSAFRTHVAGFEGHLTKAEWLALLQKLDKEWTPEQVHALLEAAGYLDADTVPCEPFLTWIFSVTSDSVRPITEEEREWVRLGGTELEETLSKEWIRLVRADWLVKLADAGGKLQRRQDLPQEAFLGLDELKRAGAVTLALSKLLEDDEDCLRIIVLSYPWLQPGHPDPHGENLRLIGKVLGSFLAGSAPGASETYGVLIDFTALPQAPRTEKENEVFKLALPALNIFYSHPHTFVLKVTKFPPGYPENPAYPYVLPEGSNTVDYAERGWCFAEAAMSGLAKSSSKVLDVGCDIYAHYSLSTMIKRCRTGRSAPLHPEDFKEKLNEKTFTSKKGDFDRVAKLYSDAFERRFDCARELDYHGLDWGVDAVRTLLRALPRNRSLEALNLARNEDIGSEGAALVAEVLRSNGSLQSLDMSLCNVGPDGTVALGQALCSNSSLRSLNLKECSIGGEGAAALGQALQCSNSLQSLDLTMCGVGVEGAVALAQALHSNRSLQSLCLDQNGIAQEGATALAQALQKSASLESLDLHASSIGEHGAIALGQALRSNRVLRSLVLAANDVGEEGGVALGQGLRSNRSLRRLDLDANRIGKRGALALGEALQAGCLLQSLCLRGNDIGDEGAVALGQALQSNSSLEELGLRSNGVGAEGAVALGQALQGNSSLRELELWSNRLGVQGAVALGRALQSNSTLRSLGLRGNGIGDQGASAFGQALQSNSSLQELNLHDNNIGEQGAIALAQALQSNGSLQQLTLRDNAIGDEGAAALQAAPTCRIIS